MTPSNERPSILSGKARAKVYEISDLAEVLMAVNANETAVDAEMLSRGVRRLGNIINNLALDALGCPALPSAPSSDNPT